MPIFQYDTYRNPYGPSIAEALQHQADPQAAAALRSGDIEARAAQQQGALRAQQFSTLGAIPGEIQAERDRAIVRQRAAQQQQIGAQQLELGGYQVDAARRDAKTRNVMDAELRNPANRNPDGSLNDQRFMQALQQQDVGAWQTYGAMATKNEQARLELLKTKSEINKNVTDADEKAQKLREAQTTYLGKASLSAYDALQQKPDDPLHARDTANTFVADAIASGAITPQQGAQFHLQTARAGPDQLAGTFLQMTDPELRAKVAKDRAETAASRATAARPVPVTPNTTLISPPDPNAPNAPPTVLYTAPSAPPRPGEGQHVVNGQVVGPEGERIGAPVPKQVDPTTAGDVTTLSPEGLDVAATMYLKTGVMVPLGMGDKSTRKAIINRAAELAPGLDIASNKAAYTANTQSLQAMQKQRDAIGAFEQTARKNIDIFLATAEKIVDTGSPLANGLVRQVTGKMLGSPDQAAYDAARQVAVNEIAKIVSNPTLAGTLSDSARHEVDAFNPGTATLAQSVRVMRLLKQDMDNRTSALDDAIGGIKGRIKKGAPETGGGGVKVLSIVPVP